MYENQDWERNIYKKAIILFSSNAHVCQWFRVTQTAPNWEECPHSWHITLFVQRYLSPKVILNLYLRGFTVYNNHVSQLFLFHFKHPIPPFFFRLSIHTNLIFTSQLPHFIDQFTITITLFDH